MNGFLVINKSLGYTSRDVVNIVGGILNTKKIGHTGTLDPNASGVLIICLGKALKMIELMDDFDKDYEAEIILGLETDTLDTDKNSTVIREKKANLEKDFINKVVDSFKGTYLQEVPKYSAIKVNGRKLYEYARSNTPIDLPKKEVTISDIKVISDITSKDDRQYFKIRCSVSKGTYIRSLVRDIGNKLGVPATMNTLIRTRIGDFSIKDGYTLDDIKDSNYRIIDILDAFSNIKQIVVDKEMAKKIKNGMILDKFFDDDLAFILDDNNELLALYKNLDNKSRPYKMFI